MPELKAAGQSFRFSSKYTDAETGLAYFGQRYYDPSLGRFINRDPLGENGGENLYLYARNNPVNVWDYLGMQSTTESDLTPEFTDDAGNIWRWEVGEDGADKLNVYSWEEIDGGGMRLTWLGIGTNPEPLKAEDIEDDFESDDDPNSAGTAFEGAGGAVRFNSLRATFTPAGMTPQEYNKMRRGAGLFGGLLDYMVSKTIGRFIPKIPMSEKQKPMDAPGKAVKQFIPNMRDGMIQVADAGATIGMASGGVSIYTELTYQERHSILGIEFWGGKQTEIRWFPTPEEYHLRMRGSIDQRNPRWAIRTHGHKSSSKPQSSRWTRLSI